MQRRVHRLHTLQDVFFFKLSAFRQQHLVCPEHSDWVKKSRIHQAKEESVWVLQDISRSYHRTSLPQHHIPSYFHAHRHCHHVYLLHQFTMSHHSWIISNHVRRLSRNLQEHIILNPSHLHDGLVISGNISLVGWWPTGGLQDSHQESKPCKAPRPTTS